MKFVRREILGDVQKPVDAGAEKKTQIVTLQTVVGAVAGGKRVVAVFAHDLIKGEQHGAEKGAFISGVRMPIERGGCVFSPRA